MWGIVLSLALGGCGVILIVLSLQAQNTAKDVRAAALFKWVPKPSDSYESEAFLNSSSYNFAMDAPEYTSFYLWNLTNAEALLVGDSAVQPELQQLGPYTYEKRSRKLNVQFYPIDDDAYDPATYGAVSYQVVSTYHFSGERSNGSESDRVVTLNATYARHLNKLNAQFGYTERFLAAEFAHQHIRDYARHLQTDFLAATKLRGLRALLPEMVSTVRREGLDAVITRQQHRVLDASLPAALVRMDAVARTEQIPVMLRGLYRDQADMAIPGLLKAQFALARRQAVPRVLSNMHNRLLVEAVPALLDKQISAQQVNFVPRTLNSLNIKMQRLAFPYVAQEIFERACLEVVPFLLRSIKNELVAQDITNNQATANDAQHAVVDQWRLMRSTSTNLDGWIDDSPTGQSRAGFELLPISSNLQLSLEVATLLLGSRPSNLRFSLVDYDAAQTAADAIHGPSSTAVGFAIWKQVVALNATAINYVLEGVNSDVGLPSDYLTRDQLMAVRDYIIGWTQSSITLRDRQRFWRKAFTKRTVNSDVNDPDVDLDFERVGVQSGFSLIPLSSSTNSQVSVGVAQQVWNNSIEFAFVHPAGFTKWMSVADGVATASSSGLLAGITGITTSEIATILAWIASLLADGFVRRRALLHWKDGTCTSVMQLPRANGCLRYDLEPNIDGQQLGFEMNPTAITNIGAGLSETARDKLWDATLAVSFLVPVHASNTATSYGQWLHAIRTGNFMGLINSSVDLTTLAVTTISAQAIGAWLSSWADNELNKLAVYYWWLRSTCWPREVISKVLSSTASTTGLSDCTVATNEQELTTVSSTTADESPFSTLIKTYQVTEDTCSAVGAQFTRTRNTYTLTARLFSCDMVSTGLADDMDDATGSFELMPLEHSPTERISLAAAIVLWHSEIAISFRNLQGYQRWVTLAASISSSAATASADSQAVANEINAAITTVCQQTIRAGGPYSAIFNTSMTTTSCTQVTVDQVTRIADWVNKHSASAWVKNTIVDQWRRGEAGALDIEPYRDGNQSGLELTTGCETELSSLTLSQCHTITTNNGTSDQVPREALNLWNPTHQASFLTVAGYKLWDSLALAVESNNAANTAASQMALATLCGSSGSSSSWEVWMERVLQWINGWKNNEHLHRDVLGHWLYASCPTTPTIVSVLSEPTPVTSVASTCTASYSVVLATSVAEIQQLASRPLSFFDADIVQKSALVRPRKTVLVNEAWVRCSRSTSSSSFVKIVGSRQSQKEYQACNLLSVLAQPTLDPSNVTPLDAMFELNRSTGATISIDAANIMWDSQSDFSLLDWAVFSQKWYPAIDSPDALRQTQDDLNTFVGKSPVNDLAALQSYLIQWESSDAAASSVSSSWIFVSPASVDVDIHQDGDQRGFELYQNNAYPGLALPTLAQAKILWATSSTYAMVRSDISVDTAGLPTGFRAWAEIYEGVDWESEHLVRQYPLTSQVVIPTTVTHTLNGQQRTQLLAAMIAATTLTEAQLRGIARWLLNWATDDSLLDFVRVQWATGKTFRGDSTVNLDLASHVQRLYSFPVTSDMTMTRDQFTAASPDLADASRTSLRKLWNVSVSGSLVDPAARVIWCLLNVTDSIGNTKKPCVDLLDGYGQLGSTAVEDFVAIVQPTIPDMPIAKDLAILSSLAQNFLMQELGLTAKHLTAVVRWYRSLAEASLFLQIYQLDAWSKALTVPSRDPLQFGFELAFVLPWNASIPRNASVDNLVPNVAVLPGTNDEIPLSECILSLSLLYTLWDASNPVSFLHPTGVTKWLSFIRGEVNEVELIGGASATNPTAKAINSQKLSVTNVSCLCQLVGHWIKSWTIHPSASMFVEELWIAPVTQGSTATTALLPSASRMASAFPLQQLVSSDNVQGGSIRLYTTEWWTAAAQVVLNAEESIALTNPNKGFPLWRALLIACFTSDRATGECQAPSHSSQYEVKREKALGILSRSLANRVRNVSTAFINVGAGALLNLTTSMIQTRIIPWLLSLLDHSVLEQYVLGYVRQVNGYTIAHGPASFVDLATVQFINGSVTSAHYVVSDSSSGELVLSDPGVPSERYPREEFVLNSVSEAIVKQNSSFLPGFGELLAFCNEGNLDRRFAYDTEIACSFTTNYSISISEARVLWTAFGFNDTTVWKWPTLNSTTNASESGVPIPSAIPSTFRSTLLLEAFLAQPFESTGVCKSAMTIVIQAFSSDWSALEKQNICVDRSGESGVGSKGVYLQLPMLQMFNAKHVSFVLDLQAYLRYSAAKFVYEPSVLGLMPSQPRQQHAQPFSLGGYPVGGYFASQMVSEILFASLPSEAGEFPTKAALWPNSSISERGASTFTFVVPLENDAALYRKSRNVIGRLLSVDNKLMMNAWGEDVKLSSVRVTDSSQFATAIRVGLGENTLSSVEFPPQKLYFYWAYARRVAQITFDSNTTRFGVPVMRYRVDWTLPSRLPTGILSSVTTLTPSINVSFLNDDVPLILQSSSSPDSPNSVIDIDPRTGAVLHRRFVWQLTAHVGGSDDRSKMLDVWHKHLTVSWLPVVWIQEETGMSADTSTQMPNLGPLSQSTLSKVGIAVGSCFVAVGCVLVYLSIRRAKMARLQRFTSIVPEKSSTLVANEDGDLSDSATEERDANHSTPQTMQTIVDQTDGVCAVDTDKVRQETTTKAWLH